MKILKGLLMIITAPVTLVLTLFVWLCTGLIYISGLVLGLLSTVIALLGVAVLITYSPQNGVREARRPRFTQSELKSTEKSRCSSPLTFHYSGARSCAHIQSYHYFK